jgi:hypothetical protein
MTQKQNRSESPDKGAASASPKAETPMERFKGLTRQLLGVSHKQLKTEQGRYEKKKKSNLNR